MVYKWYILPIGWLYIIYHLLPIVLGGGSKYVLFSPGTLGKWSNLTGIFFKWVGEKTRTRFVKWKSTIHVGIGKCIIHVQCLAYHFTYNLQDDVTWPWYLLRRFPKEVEGSWISMEFLLQFFFFWFIETNGFFHKRVKWDTPWHD